MSLDAAAVRRDLEQREALFASLRHLEHTSIKLRDDLNRCTESKSGRLHFDENETDSQEPEIYEAR